MSLPSYSKEEEQVSSPPDRADLSAQPDLEADVPEQPGSEHAETSAPHTASDQAADADKNLMPVDNEAKRQHGLVLFITKYFGRQSPKPSRALVAKETQLFVPAPVASLPKSRAPSFLRRRGLFLATVVLPTFLSILYFGFYASDIYVSESSYVVRSPNKKSMASGLGAMLEGAGFSGFSKAPDDVYTVGEYVRSRDALEYLQKELDLKTIWCNGKIDILHRFDPLGLDGSKEALYEYYLKRVDVHVDPMSGITSLKVSAFDADTSFRINTLLISEAERLVNILNDRGRNDLIRFAENEVLNAEQKAKNSALALSNYRNEQSVMDPVRQTQLHYEHISRLQEELVKTRTQLTQLKVFSPQSPRPPALELREKTLENEVYKEMQKITGGENSLASKAADYERLTLDREFADRQLASALASLEIARNEAQRQQLYLETIAKPMLPDDAMLPKRTYGVLTTIVLGFIAWGILSMLLAGVREHQY